HSLTRPLSLSLSHSRNSRNQTLHYFSPDLRLTLTSSAAVGARSLFSLDSSLGSLSLLVTSLSLLESRETHSLSPNRTKHHPILLVFGANPCKFWRALVHSKLHMALLSMYGFLLFSVAAAAAAACCLLLLLLEPASNEAEMHGKVLKDK
ncbi:hypothetical protein Prudu_021753, partial [Prunus dulcis]